MSLIDKNTTKGVVIFLICFWLVGISLLFWLKAKRTPFKQTVYEQMVSGTSTLRNKTDDPCAYSIYGDPNTKSYIKVQIECESQRSLSSFDYEVLKTKTVQEVLETMAKIGNFDITVNNGVLEVMGKYKSNSGSKWTCSDNGQPILRLNQKINPEATIICSYKTK